MRVHLIKEKTILQFCLRHSRGKMSFEAWLSKVSDAQWITPGDIKDTFRSADLLGKGSARVVFDVGGNNYRMICKYVFGEKQIHLFVCWIGTHADYTVLCSRNEQYTIWTY